MKIEHIGIALRFDDKLFIFTKQLLNKSFLISNLFAQTIILADKFEEKKNIFIKLFNSFCLVISQLFLNWNKFALSFISSIETLYIIF